MTDWATDVLRTGGWLALAFVMLLENVFPPIPSEAVLPFAGFLVGSGRLGLITALTASTAGSVGGAVLLYALGRYGGRPVVLRWRHVLRLSEADLDRVDDWFDHHGAKVVLFARMVPVARSVVSVPAGLSEMPFGRFVLLTTAGTFCWNAALIAAGVALGAQYERVSAFMSTYSTVLLVATAVAALAVAVWLRRRRRVSRPRARSRAR